MLPNLHHKHSAQDGVPARVPVAPSCGDVPWCSQTCTTSTPRGTASLHEPPGPVLRGRPLVLPNLHRKHSAQDGRDCILALSPDQACILALTVATLSQAHRMSGWARRGGRVGVGASGWAIEYCRKITIIVEKLPILSKMPNYCRKPRNFVEFFYNFS